MCVCVCVILELLSAALPVLSRPGPEAESQADVRSCLLHERRVQGGNAPPPTTITTVSLVSWVSTTKNKRLFLQDEEAQKELAALCPALGL